MGPNSSKKSNALSERLVAVIEAITRVRLENYARLHDLAMIPLEEKDRYDFDHWVVLSDIKSRVVEISIRLHFVSQCAKYLARSGLDLATSEITSIVAHEFVKEFANLSSGAIEQQLIRAGIEPEEFDLNVEIPKEIPAYDEVDFASKKSIGNLDKIWKFTFDDQELICGIKISIKDVSKLSVIENLDPNNLPGLTENIIDFL